jgi:hypothetical protein
MESLHSSFLTRLYLFIICYSVLSLDICIYICWFIYLLGTRLLPCLDVT